MAKKRRESEAEKAARERREKVELLKMKQGLIEESEVVPESGYEKSRELHGWEKFTNFLYLNKAFVVWGAIFVFIIGLCLGQYIFRERFDLHVIIVTSSHDSELNWRYPDFERTLEKYCPDFDGNGKVNVTVNMIDRDAAGEVLTEMEQVNSEHLSAELMRAEAQLIIADEEFADWFIDEGRPEKYFLAQTDNFDGTLYRNVGIRVNETGFTDDMNWKGCPDDVIFLIREELNDGSGKVKRNAEYRERAREVLRNILDGNVINPDSESSE